MFASFVANTKDCVKIIAMLTLSLRNTLTFLLSIISVCALTTPVHALDESLQQRLERKITLDANHMNVIDVFNYLSKQGEFNTVISPEVSGQTTLTLRNVSILHALQYIARINHFAFNINKEIVHIMTEMEYRSAFGKKFNDTAEISIVNLQYAKPTYALSVLDTIKSKNGKITIDEDTGSMVLEDTPESIALMKEALAHIERPLDTKSYHLRYANVNEVLPQLKARIDAKAVGTTSIDDRSNQIFVRTFPGRLPEIEKIIHSLDVPKKQVLIEAVILQVTLKPGFNTGIDWSMLVNKNGKNKFNLKTMLGNNDIASNFGQIGVGSLNVDDFAAQIQALNEVSTSKILSSPSIVAMNNEESKFHVGDTIPYVSTSITGSGDSAFIIENPRFIDVGIILSVIPTINNNGMVTMRLKPKMSSIVATISSVQGGIPQVNSTEVETTLMVADGMTIVMAGLKQVQNIHSKSGVPGLMDMPHIGGLFRKTSDTIASSETVILITPHIIKATEDFTAVVGTIKSNKKYDENHDRKATDHIPQ